MSYEAKKQQLLNKSEKLNSAIESVFKADSNNLIFTPHHKQKITDLQRQSSAILEKLKKDEFEIAIIGQEDSGKSSLLNALIKTDIFPSASGRTTYTSTKLIAGSQDKVIVKLYTYNEFDSIFMSRLKTIGIENYDFENITLDKFDFNFLALDKETQKSAKLDNSYSEIEETLKYKEKIRNILDSQGGQTLTFENDTLNNFKVFVTGEEHDKSKPRATKEIIIYSSQLKAMPNSIIYDVPGFNSPTKLHKEQTEQMLKESDSIIFITDVSSPNLKGDELQTLAKGDDIFGVSLKEKLFVFGNKYDKANNEIEAQKNEEKFKDDVLSQKAIGDEKRVFVGSAGKYLVDEEIGNLNISFHDWVKNSNIDEFRQAIETYYQFDRFEVLKKKIENTQKETLKIFQELKDSISLPERISRRSLERKIESEAEKTIRKKLEENLNQIKVDLKEEFLENRYFSDGFANEVPNNFAEIDMNRINALVPKYEDNYDSINRKIREDFLHNQFLEDFSNLVTKIVDNKVDEVQQRVFNAFVSAIGNSSEIEKMAEKVFTFEQQSGKFDYLFERFGRKMLDLIIYNPVMGSKREKDYKKYRDEFLYLDSRYKNDGRILNMVISGNDTPLTAKNGIEFFKNSFLEALENLSEPKNFAQISFDSLFPQLDEMKQGSNSYEDKELFGYRKGNYSREDVLEEINRDIRNFKTVLIEAVIPVLDLETVFIKRVEKEILLMVSKLDSDEINNFILDSLDICLEKELADIDEKVEDYRRKKEILDIIEEFLNSHK